MATAMDDNYYNNIKSTPVANNTKENKKYDDDGTATSNVIGISTMGGRDFYIQKKRRVKKVSQRSLSTPVNAYPVSFFMLCKIFHSNWITQSHHIVTILGIFICHLFDLKNVLSYVNA